jgi:predicted PurR-regulated permease PerM
MMALESVSTLILVAMFLAYVLDPAVDCLEAWRIPRSVGAFLLLLAGLVLFVLMLLFIVPGIVSEIIEFARSAPKYFEFIKERLVKLLTELNVPLPENWDQALGMIFDKTREWQSGIHKLADPVGHVFKAVFTSALTLVSALVHAALVPVIAYYLLVSFDRITKGMEELIPHYARKPVLGKLGEIDRVLSGFVRGQLTICLILAVLYTLGFLVMGLDLAIVLGTMSGLFFIIPYLGTMIAIVGGSLVAFAQFRDLAHPLYVLGWVAAVQFCESYVLTPKIVGKAIGLPPVVYILAVLSGAHLFGFIGMLISIPVTAVLKVLLVSAIDAYRNSELFRDGNSGSGEQ